MTIWIGPAGRLRLYEPEAANEPQLTDQLVGGAHDGLTGTSTRDVWGRYATWKLQWNRLLEVDYGHLSAAQRGDVGQVWLVDQLKMNRCRLQPTSWSSADATAARATVLLGDSGMDRGWLLTAGVGGPRTWRSALVPALPAIAVEALVASVSTAGAPGVVLAVDALDADGFSVLASAASAPTVVPAATTLVCPAPAGVAAVFWQLRLVVPASASVQVSEQQLAQAPAVGYRPPGGSASVRLDDVSFSPTIPPWWVGSLTAREA